MGMGRAPGLAGLGAALSCFATAAEAGQVVAACPAVISASTRIPSDARLIGDLPSTSLPLWVAVLAQGAPQDVGADGVLAEREPDDETDLGDRGIRQTWEFRPGTRPFLLACRYGASVTESLQTSAQAPMLLIPLPPGVEGTCDTTTARARPDRKAQPVKEAVCRAR
jgi:hypothetical protein